MVDYFVGDPRTNRERMLAGELYISDDPESAAEARRGMKLAAQYAAAYWDDPDAAQSIIAQLLGHLGEDAHVKPPIYEAARPITLKDNVWLDGGVIVCPGVTIGQNSVIGAGVVVTRDIPADAVAVGNPARVVKSL
ncbi:hypothetical protein BKD30_06605 [Tersicoccus phoenicis]|uniref:Acetyltransferase n=1 Tax=Tersicoccus phoenicis TaxID=554083 RepID=A0A1R1LC64_9MICC|nr:maltose acetyltransferase domain-containing protein [Tersicoccus phoenicis]OMH25131.1 hypothetical protein BKD30_06605 [Tersicoccus phoenicis]